MPKIAVSASHWQCENVQKLLHDCEMIYTTNVEAKEQLYDLFGKDRVKFIPFCNFAMVELLKAHHSHSNNPCEVIGLRDVNMAFYIDITDNEKLMLQYAGYFGFKLEPRLLYDEEAIDGFEWIQRGSEKSFGEAIEGSVPFEVKEYINRTARDYLGAVTY